MWLMQAVALALTAVLLVGLHVWVLERRHDFVQEPAAVPVS